MNGISWARAYFATLFCCNHTCYCVDIVSVTSTSHSNVSATLSPVLSKQILDVHLWSDSTEFCGIGRGSSDCIGLCLLTRKKSSTGATWVVMEGTYMCLSVCLSIWELSILFRPIHPNCRIRIDVVATSCTPVRPDKFKLWHHKIKNGRYKLLTSPHPLVILSQ